MNIIQYPLNRGASSQEPDKAIHHAMAEYIFYKGKIRHALEFLEMIGLSAHILISPNGDIYECRKPDQGAYHAKGHNKNTLGCEWLLEGKWDYYSFIERIKTPYLTDTQFNKGCKYIGDRWVNRLGILYHTTHSRVDPKRKADPGDGFPWIKYLMEVGLIYKQ
jgi:N-acetyl-anhydromuramyl-L-alanine amidase AmpD